MATAVARHAASLVLATALVACGPSEEEKRAAAEAQAAQDLAARAAIADREAKAAAAAENERLAGLWAYQAGLQSGMQQTSATIYSRVPAEESKRIRLILRRHEKWGQDVYLYGGGKGFVCPPPCTIMIRYDDAESAESTRAFLPESGEPAIMLKDAAAFLARLPEVKRLTVYAMLADSGPVTIEFEVGGYDPTRFPNLPPR